VGLEARLTEDLKAAMRSGDVIRRETIRYLRTALKNEQIALKTVDPVSQERPPLTEEEELAVLQRVIKQHRDSIAEFARGNRPDLVAKEQAELEILLEYLPSRPLSTSEIEAAARAAIAELGVSGARGQGAVMRRLAAELRDRADMREVSQIVQRLLSGGEA